MFGFLKSLITPKPNYKYKAIKMHPKGKEAHGWLWEDDWDSLSAEFAKNDAGNKNLLIQLCIDKYHNESIFDNWIKADPKSAAPHIFKGANMVFLGWEYRSGFGADEVSEKQFKKFWDALELAHAELVKAIELADNPIDRAEALYHMQNVMRGLEFDPDLEEKNYRELEACGVDHLLGAISYLSARCEKWGGSHHEMFGFARLIAANPKSPSYMQSLLCMAHTERWLYAAVFQDDDDEVQLDEGKYFEDPAVIAELEAADDKFTFQNEGQLWGFDLIAANQFAYVWSRVGDPTRAKRHFDAIGYSVTEGPWDFHKTSFFNLNRAKAMTQGAG